TQSARPAANGAFAGPLYFDTALVGRTASCLRLLILPITASAIPTPNSSSLISCPRGSKGNTAIERTAVKRAELAPTGVVPVLTVFSQASLVSVEQKRIAANAMALSPAPAMYQWCRELRLPFNFGRVLFASAREVEKCSERGATPSRYCSTSLDNAPTDEYRCAGSCRIARATIRSS